MPAESVQFNKLNTINVYILSSFSFWGKLKQKRVGISKMIEKETRT